MVTSIFLEAAERLKLGLLAKATDGEYLDTDYKEDLKILLTDNRVSKMLPSLVRVNRSTTDFRRAMQTKFERYAERRQFINQELEPIFQYLESIATGTDKFSSNIDAYKLGEQLGNGGLGIVYKFHHKLLEIDFAIKIFEPVFVSNDENIEGEKRFFFYDELNKCYKREINEQSKNVAWEDKKTDKFRKKFFEDTPAVLFFNNIIRSVLHFDNGR